MLLRSSPTVSISKLTRFNDAAGEKVQHPACREQNHDGGGGVEAEFACADHQLQGERHLNERDDEHSLKGDAASLEKPVNMRAFSVARRTRYAA